MIRRCAVALGAMLVIAAAASAQTTRLTIAGCSCNMGNNTLAQYVAGSKASASAVTYTVLNVTLATSRTTTVQIRAAAATMSSGKPVSECEWRRNDLATWTALSTTDTFIESRVIAGVGTSWNNSVWLRCSLDWVNDPPANQSVGLVFTLLVTP